ncbi:hypothetical protein N7539_006809 [Penicillium diatomitis]|uniref:Uncharacterized protein n=1 Tax=Penicillium diatomitis TaxID=2819901 RepID=A0A9W9X1Y4_9EURO|nr:uncharacterized protein N7539_006809 [Penicillium diatomitis]KAJ5480915.1 hypothetical protein N7539_006809 [Penicillium diatomitis]
MSELGDGTLTDKPRLFSPPFQKSHELQHRWPIFAPVYGSQDSDSQSIVSDTLQLELNTPAIDTIYQHLWLAGLPKAARPLHRQILLGRTIVITENPNEHLVWVATRIFIKPLPECILSHDFWTTEGAVLLQHQSLHRSACGLLLSYCWLIRAKSDLGIAQNKGLVPKSITWEEWARFATDIVTNVELDSLDAVSKRYHFGELRLTRLNLIYRVLNIFSARVNRRVFMSEPLWTKAFLERNFAWIFSVFAFVSIVAGSMQVGLGTDLLHGDVSFQRASVVFTAGSLLAVVLIILLVGAIWVGLAAYHIIRAKENLKIVRKRRTEGQNSRNSV